jgi:hypothetical protein
MVSRKLLCAGAMLMSGIGGHAAEVARFSSVRQQGYLADNWRNSRHACRTLAARKTAAHRDFIFCLIFRDT